MGKERGSDPFASVESIAKYTFSLFLEGELSRELFYFEVGMLNILHDPRLSELSWYEDFSYRLKTKHGIINGEDFVRLAQEIHQTLSSTISGKAREIKS